MSVENEKVLALGLTATQWVELLNGKRPKAAKKAINYFDGHQEEEMESFLSDPHKGRKEWKERGYVARHRNITRMVVEKSGRLFQAGLPKFDIFRAGQTVEDQELNKRFSEEISKVEFHEVFTQFDQIVRLLKTGILLVQYDIDEKKMVLDLLHRGNCAVMINPTNKQIQGLLFRISDDELEQYRLFTETEVIDLAEAQEQAAGKPRIIVTDRQPNPWKIVPAVPFYDTTIPRSGFWVDGGYDLIALNEMVNMHITESEWALTFQKRPTLFTNATLNNNEESIEITNGYGTNGFQRMVGSGATATTGPDKVIQVNTQGVDNPFVEYKAPIADLKTMDDVVQGWITTLAQDWSVRIRPDREARATSGFQLVVEGMDNRELRITRQRMMEQGLKRFYRVFRTILNSSYGTEVFPVDSDLFVEFALEDMPVDALEQETMWDARIAGGRGSVISYLMETKGISREEAVELALQYKADAELLAPAVDVVVDTPEDPNSNTFEPIGSGSDGEDKADEQAENEDQTASVIQPLV